MDKFLQIIEKENFKTDDSVTREVLNVFTAIKQFRPSLKNNAINLKELAISLSENYPNDEL